MNLKSNLVCIILFCVLIIPALPQESGKIIFSKKMINPSSPAELSTEFQAGDHIYAVAFFDKNILGLSGKSAAKSVNLEIFIYELKPPLYDYQQPSEVQLETSSLIVSGSALQNNYLFLDILPSSHRMTAYGNQELVYKQFGPKFYGPVQYAERLSRLKAGEHKIIVRVKCNYQPVSQGSFVIRGDDYTVYQKLSADLNQAASSLKTRGVVMPQPARSDQKLEAEMLKAFKASQTYRDRVKGKILKIVIIDPDWMIRRNRITGVILHRYIRADIAVKNSDGTCTLWKLVTFQQDYVGNRFQETKFDGIGDPIKIPCENVNK